MALLSRRSISSLQSEASEPADGGLRRTLSGLNLLLLGVGAMIGAGIFELTGRTAASYSGPGVVLSMVLAGIACGFAALCYAELASLMPIAGSAYSYTYAALGEVFAWVIGWDLMLEYVLGASTVAARWSGHLARFLGEFGITLPHAWAAAPIAVD